jgi:hypothetical protein
MDGVRLVEEVNKLQENAGTEGAVVIMLIVCVFVLCMLCFTFLFVNIKHNRKIAARLKVKEEAELICLEEKLEIKETLDKSQKTIHEINSINKANQIKMDESAIREKAMFNVFQKLAEKL